jgi:PST family polysaccharide transporter
VSVAIAAAWYGAGYWALVYNHLVTTSVQAIGYWVGCKWRPGLPIRGSGVKEMLKFGGHFTGSNLTDFFSRNLDNILIGKFWGAEELGLYSRAYQLMLMPIQQISGPIGAVAFPALSRLEDSPAEYRRFYLRIIEKISMVVMPGAALMCATSDWVVQFLIGPQWKETGRIFMFLAACAAVQPITETVVWLFSTQRRTREMLSWSFVAAAISIVSICAGLPWGAVGVAASYSSAYFCLTTPLLFWFVGRRGVVSTLDFYRTLYPSFLAGLASLAVLLLSHWWLATIEPAALRLFTAFLMAGFTSLFVFSVLPRGRMALRHFRDLLVRVVSARDSKLGA